jgi:FAD/FMN-containing dehydrogenase
MAADAPHLNTPSDALIRQFESVVGAANCLTDPFEQAPHLKEWRDRYTGATKAVLKPKSVDEVSRIMQLANDHRVGVVAQGGNTGLVGGQIPRPEGADVVLSLERLSKCRALDPDNQTLTVEAGCKLATAQAFANEAGLLFPLSMASEGSATIGGNIATNAGGLNVLAYGTARALTLGLEVVLADGTIWNGLGSLKKDNTGYALKELFAGSEGTLGIITAATLKLYPKPAGQATAMVALNTLQDVAHLFRAASMRLGPELTAFEFMCQHAVDFTTEHMPQTPPVFEQSLPWTVLIEVSNLTSDDQALQSLSEVLMVSDTERRLVATAIATSSNQRQAFWKVREGISEAQKFEGGSIKHDVSVAPAAIPDFIAAANQVVEDLCPGARPCPFGHFGDGNVHYNISQPSGADTGEFLDQWQTVQDAVHDVVAKFDGSISAEHGIGVMKRETLARHKDPAALTIMRRIKSSLDPNGILNPGKLL